MDINNAAVHDTTAAAHTWSAPPAHHDPPAYHPLDPHHPPEYHPNPNHPHPPHHSPLLEPPPSYEDATGSPSAPLLADPVSNYGTWQDSDETSTASTEFEPNEIRPPQWLGSFVIVVLFAFIMYCLWRLTDSLQDGQDDCRFPNGSPCHFG